jgi:hypothetical protein|tara:strand:- start:1713 stop:2213 length:501 start_codon:yes stop_codon:yes gene_type:complete
MDTDIQNFLNFRLAKIAKKFVCVSDGGCGYFAKFLSDALTANGMSNSIHIAHTDNASKVDSFIKENNNVSGIDFSEFNNFDWGHVYVKLDNLLIDVDGVYSDTSENFDFKTAKVSTEVSSNFLAEFVSEENAKYWNTDYLPNGDGDAKGMNKAIKAIVRDMQLLVA